MFIKYQHQLLIFLILSFIIINTYSLRLSLYSKSHNRLSSRHHNRRGKVFASANEEDDVQKRIAAMLENDSTPLVNSNEIKESVSESNKLINVVCSAALAFGLFLFQHFQPASALTLLKQMEKESPTLQEAFCSNKPTIIDFYADWCENCKAMAPTMRQLEYKYGNSVNFVAVDGSNPKNSKLRLLIKICLCIH